MAHKHEVRESRTHAWSACIAKPHQHCDGSAHGGVTFVEKCECGAVRKIESNGKHTLAGIWYFPEGV